MSIFFRVVIAEAGNFEELLYSNESFDFFFIVGVIYNYLCWLNSFSPSVSHKDLWLAVREGSLADVDSALTLLKKTGGTVNCRNRFGLTPLHIATWRNHLPIIQRLVAAGADPDAKDGESGWSSLHRALHFGHLAVASILLQSGASITLEDSKCRTPIDLLSGPVLKVFESGLDSVATEVFSWGSGVNYQLGTGNAHIQKLPSKLDSFHGSIIKLISAAKFHSVAVTAHGKVYTWGFGRGGRLGHPDFDIHSGQAAVITTRQVTFGLGARRVKAIAAAKHHTVVATESGEVFTWGYNREGQLGYGTSNSASIQLHTVFKVAFSLVCGMRIYFLQYGPNRYKLVWPVYTWCHRLVSPRRVVITRNLKKSGSTPMKFHRKERLHVFAMAAGMVHSMAMTEDGALFYWVSSDPDLRCQQLYSLCEKTIVSISAGKYWAATATATGDVYMWDGKKSMDKPPVATRLHGVKRATSVSVGETHLLSIVSLYHPIYPPNMPPSDQVPKLKVNDEVQELDEDVLFNDPDSSGMTSSMHKIGSEMKTIPSLKSLCEKVEAECLMEPQNAIQLLEIADSLGADDLRKYCEDIVIRNLDYILTVSSQAFASASPDVLASLEKSLDSRSTESWSYRQLPSPTATFPVIINSDEDDSESEVLRTRDNKNKTCVVNEGDRLDSFLQPKDYLNQGISEQVQALQKKLQQIESKGSCSASPDAKGNKKAEVSRKQRRKSKQRVAQVERVLNFSTSNIEPNSVKDISNIKIPQVLMNKEENAMVEGTITDQASEKSTFFVQRKESSVHAEDKSTSQTTTKKKNRKGGLSMFLSSALDDAPKHILLPPPTPRSEGPAWGGAKVLKGKASLREIQDEQSKLQVNWLTGSKNQVEDLPEGKQLHSLSHSPKPKVSGCPTATGQDSPLDSPAMSRWFKPEVEATSSIRSIQIEERAMKDLKRFYSSVKVVKKSRKLRGLNDKDI
ncbi:hypothetical protein ES319_A13G181100v1 [Gossypium barbadense]|uniref:Uncharacterized protein n=1 Tax=Gossypium barbadense TaxID=3634 RepID=A0A5J5T402_GOSBA|nr:hypothetical protein ES319_A13G181100v1 [Gossypium barbadense]